MSKETIIDLVQFETTVANTEYEVNGFDKINRTSVLS